MLTNVLILYAILCCISYSYLCSVTDCSKTIRFLLSVNFAILLSVFAITRAFRKTRNMLC